MTTMINRGRMRDRARHIDLLDQVADSTEERDNVRRILGAETRQPGMRNLNAPRIESGQLSERELDTANAERWASVLADRRALVRLLDEAGSAPGYSACSGPCAQGRKPCPTSDACECPERAPLRAGDLVRVAALFLASWAAVVAVLLVAGVRL